LPQSKIQKWIEAIPYYIKEIIRLEGGNKYKEGRKRGEEKILYIRIKVIKKQSKSEAY
jgi:hypothetical protein